MFLHKLWKIIDRNGAIRNKAEDTHRQLWWPIGINFPQSNWKRIYGILDMIYGGKWVLHHMPTWWINQKIEKMHIYMSYQTHPSNNLLIIDWKLPLIFNFLLICNNTNKNINKIKLHKKRMPKPLNVSKYMLIFG